MTNLLYDLLQRRYAARDEKKPWVFWGRSWDHANGGWIEGPYRKRKDLMKELCNKAGVVPPSGSMPSGTLVPP